MRLFLDFSTWQGLSWRNEEQQQHFQIILFMPTLLCTCGFVWHLKCESCCDLISPHFCECFVEHPILREPERCWLDKPHFAPFLWKFSLSIQSFRFQQYMMPGISLISDFYTVYISEHISNELAITPMLFPHFVNVLLGWVQSSERRLSLSRPIP